MLPSGREQIIDHLACLWIHDCIYGVLQWLSVQQLSYLNSDDSCGQMTINDMGRSKRFEVIRVLDRSRCDDGEARELSELNSCMAQSNIKKKICKTKTYRIDQVM